MDFEVFGELARQFGADLWKTGKKVKKSAWTSGKNPLMTKGGSLFADNLSARNAKRRNSVWQ
ncbi:MAG: hypothetical protein WC076_10295 [Terrimicrobiaceae bacterium]